MLTYAVLNTLIALTVRITGGRIEPREYDSKEHWTLKPPGKKPWFIRAARRWGPFRGSSEKQERTPAHVTDENILLSSSRSGTSDQKQGFNEPITVPMRVLRSASLSE
jgi:adenine/guanine/hypoxanthine permease